MTRLHVLFASVFLFFVACFAHGQENGGVFLSNQKVRVSNLPSLTAASKARPAVLATGLEIVLHDKAVCCGKDSALADAVLYESLSDPLSLKELGAKLQGRHLTSDNQPIVVSAQYVPESSISADSIVRTLLEQHALLIEWKSHVYVLYGALFNEIRDYSGAREFTVVKLFLIDPRFSDDRREVVFNRETDDLGKVQAMLLVTFTIPPSPWK